MLKTKSISVVFSISLSLLAAPSYSQDVTDIQTLSPSNSPTKKIVRVVEAIPMWVDSEKLRVRDNPYAGDVVGILVLGQKVKVQERADNWIRISSPGKPPKWVNSDFLSKSRVTWSNYEFGSRSRNLKNSPYDIDLKRIKIKDLKDMKIYAAHIKAAQNNSRVIITRHDFRSGPYYEKRMVQCGADGSASHVRMLGEGYNYIMMEKDPRGAVIVDPNSTDHVIDADTTTLNREIAEFTCEAKKI